MKTGILTFHCADNYGAVLQTYGLKCVLESLGHESFVVDYRPDYLTRPYELIDKSRLNNFKDYIRAIFAMPIRYRRHEAFRRFCKSRLNLIDMDKTGSLDAVIVGSDQIWNPNFHGNSFDPVFLLDMPEIRNKKKIAYAASAGSANRFESGINDNSLASLKSFDAISVRESNIQGVLEEYGISSYLVADPVLLAGKGVFDKICPDKKLYSPYLLSFSLTYIPEVNELAQKIAAEKNLSLIQITSLDEAIWNNKVKNTSSPEEFIWYIKNASGIVTTSFHGTIFSLLYDKPFMSVGLDATHKDRVYQLLKELNVINRYVDMHEADSSMFIWDCESSSIQNEISSIRDKSLEFLKSNL